MRYTMISFPHYAVRCGLLLLVLIATVACQREPQKVRHISQQEEPDSALMAQMAFNMKIEHVATG